MINFQMDEEQRMLTDAIGRFARERVRRVHRDAEEEKLIPHEVIGGGWELGLLTSSLPEAYGGFGDYAAVTQVLALEELGWGDLSIALAILTPNLVAIPLMLAGSEAQKEAYLPLFAEMAPPQVTAALVEPRLQFDPRHLETTAERQGNEYVLNGAKAMVPLAGDATLFLVYAQEGEGVQAFLVPRETPGLTVREGEQLMGLRALPTARLELTDCRVPASARLGEDAGSDFDLLLNHSRIAQAALAVGMARGAFEYARDYAKTRQQFGEPIAHRQSIAFMLAEMAIDVDAARLLAWEAAWLMDQGQDALQATAVMKHYVDDMVLRVCDQALQVLGGYGYIREYPVELWLRNARGFVNFDGLAMA